MDKYRTASDSEPQSVKTNTQLVPGDIKKEKKKQSRVWLPIRKSKKTSSGSTRISIAWTAEADKSAKPKHPSINSVG